MGSGEVDEIQARSEDAITSDPQEPVPGVVIDESDNRVGRILGAVNEQGNLVPDIPGAIDKDWGGWRLVGAPPPIPHGSEYPPARRHDEERHGRHQPHDAKGKTPTLRQREFAQRKHEQPEHGRDARHEEPQRCDLVIAAHPAASKVKVGAEAHHDLKERGTPDVPQGQAPALARQVEVITHSGERQEGQAPRRDVPADHAGSACIGG
jgi:hypothetical protein